MKTDEEELPGRLRDIAGFLRRVTSGYTVQTAQNVMTLGDDADACDQAADTIAALRRENEAMRAALTTVATWPDEDMPMGGYNIRGIARDALAPTPEPDDE